MNKVAAACVRPLMNLVALAAMLLGGQAFAFEVPGPNQPESRRIGVGNCDAAAYNTSQSTAQATLYGGNVGGSSGWSGGAQVQYHYENGATSVGFNPNNVVDVTAAQLLEACGIQNGAVTLIKSAVGSYASQDILGYRVEGLDPKNENIHTIWEVAVSGVTNTQLIATKRYVRVQSDEISSSTGAPIAPLNVLVNDMISGSAPTLANSTLTVVSPAHNPGVVLDPATGMVTTTATVPPGIYSITYQLCDKGTPALCDSTTVTVTIDGSVAPQPDTATGNAGVPITPLNVLANDMTDGSASTPANSILIVVTPASNPGVFLDPRTGMLTTTAAVPAGTYTLTYQLCTRRFPAVCAEATVTVTLNTSPGGNNQATPVPTLSQYGLMALGALLVIFGIPVLRRVQR